MLPLALLLYSADRPLPQTLKRLTPLFLLMAVMLVVALSLPTYRHLLAVSLDTRTIGENLLTQSRALLYLAGQLIRITNGNADPQLPAVSVTGLAQRNAVRRVGGRIRVGVAERTKQAD